MSERTRDPYLYEISIILFIFLTLAVWSLWSNISISIPMIVTWFTMIILGKIIGLNYLEMQHAIKEGIFQGLDAILILLFIGTLVGSWIKGGVVITIIYYGLKAITPWLFLPCTVLLCSVSSVVTGTSWGTAGTLGIAMMEIGRSMGIPAPAVAGAVLSGAYFGDKLSLLSDSVILSSSMSKVDIFKHMKGLLPISISSLVLSLIAFYFVNQHFIAGDTTANSAVIINAIEEKFVINPIAIFPMIIVITLLSLQVPAVPVLAIGSLCGIACGIFIQGIDFASALSSVYSNQADIDPSIKLSAVDKYIAGITSRGGIESMVPSIVVILFGLGLSGLMDKLSFMKIISSHVKERTKTVFQLNMWTMIIAFLCNIMGGTMYVPLIMTPKIMRKIYDDMGVDRRILSRSTEIGGTLTCAMIPWTDNGIYMSKILGLSTFEYVPYMFLSIFAIIINIIFSYTDIFMWKHKRVKAH